MGNKYTIWDSHTSKRPETFQDVKKIIEDNRKYTEIQSLAYGDYGLEDAFSSIRHAIEKNKRIALYADYDVDGTMSCVCWVWFLKALGHENYVHYIPDRFKEGYGVNLEAVKFLANDEKAEIIVTMDTGITANEEASWCKENGIEFICTDHHKIQKNKMPDCIILNPKTHPDPLYQELCGCGVTFVLLRKLGRHFGLEGSIWIDLLALTGMATICDIVPLNGVNHSLAKLGVQALKKSRRSVLVKLLEACSAMETADETDVGFKLGPRINAVGRLEHADKIIEAFVSENPDSLIEFMSSCNQRRRQIQEEIFDKAYELAELQRESPILFLGYEGWHQGVVGIAASKLVEAFWKPVWLFSKDKTCKGSARSIEGFDVTDAMESAGQLFSKFGGHKAAGGFSFPIENEELIREALESYATEKKNQNPEVWIPKIRFDCKLSNELLNLDLWRTLHDLKPFGHKFEQPSFELEAEVAGVSIYKDKITGKDKHTAITISTAHSTHEKIMFFGEVIRDLTVGKMVSFLVKVDRNIWKGRESLALYGLDYRI